MRFLFLVPILTLVGGSTAARGQSLTTGALSGAVRDDLGSLVFDAAVTLRDTETGEETSMRTSRLGMFAFQFIAPGEYEVRVEQLGHRPVLIRPVLVLAGRAVDLAAVLTRAPPPVVRVDTVAYVGAGLTGSRPGQLSFSALELSRLPGDEAVIVDLSRFATASSDAFETEGLPNRMSGIVVDGVNYVAARHPNLLNSWPASTALPRSSFAQAEFVSGGLDVEGTDFAGAFLRGESRRGGRELELSGFLDWTGSPGLSSSNFDVGAVSPSSVRAGVLVAGPVIQDTAHFAAGLEARRVEIPRPRAWENSTFDEQLAGVAQSRFGVDLASYMVPRLESRDVVSGFGRFDWAFSPRSRTAIRASFTDYSTDNVDLGPNHSASLGSRMEGLEVQVAATLASAVGSSSYQELRVGFETSHLDYFSGLTDPAMTTITEAGAMFGADLALPGAFKRTGVRVSETLHFGVGTHRLKFGVAGQLVTHEQTFRARRGGEWFFSGPDQLDSGLGVFNQTVGIEPVADFTTFQFGGYLQDNIALQPGMELSVGARVDAEGLPTDDVILNQEWFDLTGLANDDFKSLRIKVSPRLGFTWDVGQRRVWLLTGELGRYNSLVDPGALAELISNDGGVEVRRALGTVTGWPAPPPDAQTSVVGTTLSLPGPTFEAPQTTRATFGVTRALGNEASVMASVTYRHTDVLIRRHDLNRLPSPIVEDQHGRPVYGVVTKQGGVLAASPGSNRRFAGFDVVSALDLDGFSDYAGFTLGVEKTFGSGGALFASYTYSQTTDNTFLARGGAIEDQLTPFPDSLNGVDWADGRSDLDVPHRVTLGVEVPVPGLPAVRIAGLFRARSGLPFTPGFRDGVDANGDGSARNDPAFVDQTVPGVSELLNTWACLREDNGRFVERNACRGSSVQSLDLKVGVDVAQLRGGSVELLFEALNIIDPEVAVPDRALYLVDPNANLVEDPVAGRITVPLIANANFGQPLVRRSSGRRLRFGMRVNW